MGGYHYLETTINFWGIFNLALEYGNFSSIVVISWRNFASHKESPKFRKIYGEFVTLRGATRIILNDRSVFCENWALVALVCERLGIFSN